MVNIVLFEPEIPQNTGNIMRTCSVFKMRLHLIEPLGFSLDEKHLRRSGMDYVKDLDYTVYKNWNDFYEKNAKGQYVYFTRYALKSFEECVFNRDEDIYIVFGKESTGIDKNILKEHIEECYHIPMRSDARSLNLSNCVAIAAYECLRQIGFGDLSDREVIKGADFLLKC